MAINVTLEVSNIVDRVETRPGTVAYRVRTRTATSVLRFKDGEDHLLPDLISDEDRWTASKEPFPGDIPALGRSFWSQNQKGVKIEAVLSITPRIIRNILRPGAYLAQFDGGTEHSFRARLESGRGGGQSFGAMAPSARAVATTFSYRVEPGRQVLLTATQTGAGGATALDVLGTLTFCALAASTSLVELITIALVGSGGSTINSILPAQYTP